MFYYFTFTLSIIYDYVIHMRQKVFGFETITQNRLSRHRIDKYKNN